MKILVTGAQGFLGKNLCQELEHQNFQHIYQYDLDTPEEELDFYTQNCDFVFHLAGVNRPKDSQEYMKGNFGFTTTLLDLLKKHQNTCPIMLSSSTQATLENPYGQSKLAGEEALQHYGEKTGANIYIYRFPNLFGKWSKPNYNSVVATFCHNIARGKSIEIHSPTTQLTLVYIDDVVKELISLLACHQTLNEQHILEVSPSYHVSLQTLAEHLFSFKDSRATLEVPNMSDDFTKKLYATYLSFLPEDDFSYPLHMNVDDRGSFTEFIRTPERGQVSVNISKPGITKGEHWHHTKNEKFLVVQGEGLIQFRQVGTTEIINYPVTGEKLEVIDIPTGYTHNIKNTGSCDLITVMWANEAFDPDHPDTYFERV